MLPVIGRMHSLPAALSAGLVPAQDENQEQLLITGSLSFNGACNQAHRDYNFSDHLRPHKEAAVLNNQQGRYGLPAAPPRGLGPRGRCFLSLSSR